jgi:hypothetical protein
VPVVEEHHQTAVGAVHGEDGEDRVVRGEGEGLPEADRSSRSSSSAAAKWWALAAAEAIAMGLALAPDSRTHLTAYLALFTAGSWWPWAPRGVYRVRAPRSCCSPAVCCAPTLLLRSPDLSDDVRRYAGTRASAPPAISPYAHAPSDPARGAAGARGRRLGSARGRADRLSARGAGRVSDGPLFRRR